MEFNDDKFNELIIQLRNLAFQFERFVADRESEKDTIKRRHSGFDIEIKELRDWKNKMEGERVVLNRVIAFLCSIVGALIVWAFTKR